MHRPPCSKNKSSRESWAASPKKASTPIELKAIAFSAEKNRAVGHEVGGDLASFARRRRSRIESSAPSDARRCRCRGRGRGGCAERACRDPAAPPGRDRARRQPARDGWSRLLPAVEG